MEKTKNRPLDPRPASTVILVREHEERLQVYLLKRSEQSGFFPGNYVFPGGAVDPEDTNSEFWKSRTNLSEDEVQSRFGKEIEIDRIFPYVVSAVRETFEEAGVLLAVDREGAGNRDKVREDRVENGLKNGWMGRLFVNENWKLDLSKIWGWSHWITPELMKYRFDTMFFIAFMPPDQTCMPDNREMTDGIWISPEKGLAENLAGGIPLSPPTVVTLTELLKYRSLKAMEGEIKKHNWGEERRPRLIPSKDGPVILQPWDPMCEEDGDIDRKNLEQKLLPAGATFSRIWFHDGIWRPIAAR